MMEGVQGFHLRQASLHDIMCGKSHHKAKVVTVHEAMECHHCCGIVPEHVVEDPKVFLGGVAIRV